jgi:hypothetical protein
MGWTVKVRLEGWETNRESVENSEGRRLLGNRRRKWEDNIEMGLKEIENDSVDWIHLAQDWNQRHVLLIPLFDSILAQYLLN